MEILRKSSGEIYQFYSNLSFEDLNHFYDIFIKPFKKISEAFSNADLIKKILIIDFCVINNLVDELSSYLTKSEISEVQKKYINSGLLSDKYFFSLGLKELEIEQLVNGDLLEFSVIYFSNELYECGAYNEAVFILKSEIVELKRVFEI
jgi:hypothetical protein